MKIPQLPQYALESVALLSALVLLTTTTVKQEAKLASLSTASLVLSLVVNTKQENRLKREALELETQRLTESLKTGEDYALSLELKLRTAETTAERIPQLENVIANGNSEYEKLKATLANTIEALNVHALEIRQLTIDNANAVANCDAIRQQSVADSEALRTQLEQQRLTWVAKFDEMVDDYEKQIDALRDSGRDMQREIDRFRDSKDLIIANETMTIQQRSSELQDRLTKLAQTNQALTSHVGASTGIVSELQTEFDYLTSEGFAQMEAMHTQQLELCRRELAQMQQSLTECSAPQKFEQIGDYARADTLIAELHRQTGHVLDASEITPVDDGCFEVALNVRDRKARGVSFVKSLTDLGDVLMVDTACIEPLKFRFDAQNPHRILVKLRYRKALVSAKSLPWKGREQFAGLAGKWNRVRVTGGSESGKSPLAELIVGAMQQVKGAMSVSVAFPLPDSVKNNWTLQVTHSDGYKSVLACARETVAMLTTRPLHFHVSVLDECDTALKELRDLAGEVKELIKTGSHANVGVILLGQNANVKQWSGFDRSDFENIVNVHIGGNSYHALENSNLSQDVKDKMKSQADTLTRHCESVNAGVEEPDKLSRFALVIDPAKSPYFIELPTFGSIVFDYSKALASVVPPTIPTSGGVKCTHCDSDKHKHNGKYANGDDRYKCSSCGKAFRDAYTVLATATAET